MAALFSECCNIKKGCQIFVEYILCVGISSKYYICINYFNTHHTVRVVLFHEESSLTSTETENRSLVLLCHDILQLTPLKAPINKHSWGLDCVLTPCSISWGWHQPGLAIPAAVRQGFIKSCLTLSEKVTSDLMGEGVQPSRGSSMYKEMFLEQDCLGYFKSYKNLVHHI